VGWRTSASGVAQVSGTGLVSGVTEGLATITASSEGQSASSQVTVRAPPAAKVDVTPKRVNLDVGEARQLKVAVYDAAGRELKNKRIAWLSSDQTIARVNDGGVVIGAARGEARITATVDGVSDSAQVEVNE
jgi:uncharacterized protein YjdB